MLLVIKEFVYHIDKKENIEILFVSNINNDMDSMWNNKESIRYHYNIAKKLVIDNNHFGSYDQTAFIRLKIFDGNQRMLIVSGERFNTFDEIFDNRSMERFPEPVRYGVVDFDLVTNNGVIKLNKEFHTTDKANSFIYEFVNSETFKQYAENQDAKNLKFDINKNGEIVITNLSNYSLLINATYLNGGEYITSEMHTIE